MEELRKSDEATLELFEKDELKGQAAGYRRSVASTLALHMKGLEGKPTERVLFAAAFAAPDRIPAELLGAAAGADPGTIRDALFALAGKSIVHHQPGDFGGFVSLYRLTQVVVRARVTGLNLGSRGRCGVFKSEETLLAVSSPAVLSRT
ncbi:MAG: hypothetical protein BroJett003_25990 [Planctomycetota bacterium]|nr:MAG: hypothetical protein BroJett003_25990 [Planctomycetota bacterium]